MGQVTPLNIAVHRIRFFNTNGKSVIHRHVTNVQSTCMHKLNAINTFTIYQTCTLFIIALTYVASLTMGMTALIVSKLTQNALTTNIELNESNRSKRTPQSEARTKKTIKPRCPTRMSRAHGRREETTGQLPKKPSFVTLSYFPSITCTDKAKPVLLCVDLYTDLVS